VKRLNLLFTVSKIEELAAGFNTDRIGEGGASEKQIRYPSHASILKRPKDPKETAKIVYKIDENTRLERLLNGPGRGSPSRLVLNNTTTLDTAAS
jgi:hypothetical protein